MLQESNLTSYRPYSSTSSNTDTLDSSKASPPPIHDYCYPCSHSYTHTHTPSTRYDTRHYLTNFTPGQRIRDSKDGSRSWMEMFKGVLFINKGQRLEKGHGMTWPREYDVKDTTPAAGKDNMAR